MPPGHLWLSNKLPFQESWSPAAIDDRRCLIYGPRLGRLYLISAESAADGVFCGMIGLTRRMASTLDDPSRRLAWTLAGLDGESAGRTNWRLKAAYRVFHYSRHVVPLRVTAKLVRFVAKGTPSKVGRGSAAIEAIAQTVCATERAVGFSDCYPRSVLTAYLALRCGQDCSIIVGVLAPTRKMHAWCSIDDVLPYEPAAEHYLYQPVWAMVLT